MLIHSLIECWIQFSVYNPDLKIKISNSLIIKIQNCEIQTTALKVEFKFHLLILLFEMKDHWGQLNHMQHYGYPQETWLNIILINGLHNSDYCISLQGRRKQSGWWGQNRTTFFSTWLDNDRLLYCSHGKDRHIRGTVTNPTCVY